MTRWLVSYESGRHITVMARDSVDARRMGALMWPRDSVVEVARWEHKEKQDFPSYPTTLPPPRV